MYNPDDWSKNFDLTLKYKPMDSNTINKVLVQYKHEEVLGYIKELWSLIDYQRKLLTEQTKTIVALKHHKAWERYDKPEKSGNISC
jgi:hypothetical protein